VRKNRLALTLLVVVAPLVAGCAGRSSTKLLVVTPDAAHPGMASNVKAADPQCRSEGPGVQSTVQSSLVLTGPCSSTEKGLARCVKRIDDFYVYLAHDLPGQGRFILTVNVENYHGPGTYSTGGAELYLEVTRNGQFSYWSVRHAPVYVDESTPPHVHIDKALLAAQAGTPATGTEKLSGTVTCPSLGA